LKALQNTPSSSPPVPGSYPSYPCGSLASLSAPLVDLKCRPEIVSSSCTTTLNSSANTYGGQTLPLNLKNVSLNVNVGAGNEVVAEAAESHLDVYSTPDPKPFTGGVRCVDAIDSLNSNEKEKEKAREEGKVGDVEEGGGLRSLLPESLTRSLRRIQMALEESSKGLVGSDFVSTSTVGNSRVDGEPEKGDGVVGFPSVLWAGGAASSVAGGNARGVVGGERGRGRWDGGGGGRSTGGGGVGGGEMRGRDGRFDEDGVDGESETETETEEGKSFYFLKFRI
jgi:hypothetical protein